MGLDLGSALGFGGAALKLGTGLFQNLLAGGIHPEWSQYQVSDSARQKLGLAGQLFNGRSAGAANQQQNIYNSGASAYGNIQRNATNAAQALALGAGVQGQENNAFGNLGEQEDKNKLSLLDNMNQAYDGMINEDDKVYKSKLQKYQMDTNTQNELRGAGMGNVVGSVNDAASLATLTKQRKASAGLYGGMW